MRRFQKTTVTDSRPRPLMPASILSRLRQETAQPHRELEEAGAGIPEGARSTFHHTLP